MEWDTITVHHGVFLVEYREQGARILVLSRRMWDIVSIMNTTHYSCRRSRIGFVGGMLMDESYP